MKINNPLAQPLLQRALNLMETAACWERKASKRCLIVGLQGEKRRLRWLGREAQNVVDWIEFAAWSTCGIDIEAQEGSVNVNTLLDYQSAMGGIIEKLSVIHDEAHQIANELVAAKLRGFAKPIYQYVDCLFDIIGELQRAQSEYEMANYEYHHISRYQVSWYNVHDNYECKEEKQGYTDFK